jgi:ankyrin repeat protein
MTDLQLRKPVHYAAVCENELCLKVLVEKGANLIDVDNQKFTPLHYAARANRPKCV